MEGASERVLADAGVAIGVDEAGEGWKEVGEDLSQESRVVGGRVRVEGSKGGVGVDVRDEADAWIRVRLGEGERVELKAGV